MFQFWVFKYR